MKLMLTLVAMISVAAFALGFAQGSRTQLFASLSGVGKGKAVYKVDARGARVQAEIQIGGENLPANTDYVVVAGDAEWNVTTDAFGRFKIAQRYSGNNRPNITAGTAASVMTLDGNVVQTGIFIPR
ncbi:MAG: hypothetical protein HZC36_06875 [Armatimonadetes bacterium]|nr:hypothetical protein [Armatimonadota bacterium]